MGTPQMMVQTMGAVNITPLLDSRDARRELQKLPNVGPVKSEKMAASWERSRKLLPEATLEQPPPAPEQVLLLHRSGS